MKLSDFGIARAEADAVADPDRPGDRLAGVPLARGRLGPARRPTASDVWSLGATLYHALSGQPPYEVGDNLMGALYRIVHEEPPRLADAGWLAPLLEATMTTEPDDRWSMAQVRDFLHSHGRVAGPAGGGDDAGDAAPVPLAPGPPGPPEPAAAGRHATPAEPAARPGRREPRRRRRTWLPLAIAAALVLVLGALAWVLLDRDDGTSPTIDRPDASASAGGGGGGGGNGEEPSDERVVLARAEQPTAKGMERFISDYLATAPSSPETTFAMLTPGFQAASGGIERLLGLLVHDRRGRPRSTSTPTRRPSRSSTPWTTPVRTAPRRRTRLFSNCNTRTGNI